MSRGATPAWYREALEIDPLDHVTDVDGCLIRSLVWDAMDERRPPLVLVHGAGAHARWWTFLAPRLARDRRVVALDLSGHGDSAHRSHYRLERWATEVRGVVNALGLAQPELVGHSLGAQVSACAAAQQPGAFSSVVLVDIGLPRLDRPARQRRIRSGLTLTYGSRTEALERFALMPDQPCANRFLVDHVARHALIERDGRWTWKTDLAVFAHSTNRPIAHWLRDLTDPVTVIRGAQSRVATSAVTDRVVALIGRDVPVVVIEDAYHHVLLDQPLALVDHLNT